MSASVVEDIAQLMETRGLGIRGKDIFTEADLNGWKGRTQAIIITERNQPSEPDCTVAVDSHGLTVSIVDGYGETGLTKSAERAHGAYMMMLLLTDIDIDSTFYPCIRAVTAPQIVSVAPIAGTGAVQTQYDFNIDVTRYIGGHYNGV